MIILRDPRQLSQVAQSDIKAYLRRRFDDICAPEPYDPDEHGFFILVEPGDTSDRIEAATGYSLLKSLFNDTVYGDPDFMPDFECLEDHISFFEAVYIFTDRGFAVVMIERASTPVSFLKSVPESLNLKRACTSRCRAIHHGADTGPFQYYAYLTTLYE